MSKKSTPKPAEPKAEKTEAVEGTIEAIAQEATAQEQADAPFKQAGDNPASETAEQELEASKAEESAGEAAPTPQEAPTVEPAATAADQTESTPLLAAPVAAAAPTDLANRLTLAVRAIVVTGAPEAVHALHRLEMAVGDLKNALPAAIAVADEPLKADLTGLLAVL